MNDVTEENMNLADNGFGPLNSVILRVRTFDFIFVLFSLVAVWVI